MIILLIKVVFKMKYEFELVKFDKNKSNLKIMIRRLF